MRRRAVVYGFLVLAFLFALLFLKTTLASEVEERFDAGYSGSYGQAAHIKQPQFGHYVSLDSHNTLVSGNGPHDLFVFKLFRKSKYVVNRISDNVVYLGDAFKIKHETGKWIRLDGDGFSVTDSEQNAAIFGLRNKYSSRWCPEYAAEYDAVRGKCGVRKLMVVGSTGKWALVGQCDRGEGGELKYSAAFPSPKCWEFELLGPADDSVQPEQPPPPNPIVTRLSEPPHIVVEPPNPIITDARRVPPPPPPNPVIVPPPPPPSNVVTVDAKLPDPKRTLQPAAGGGGGGVNSSKATCPRTKDFIADINCFRAFHGIQPLTKEQVLVDASNESNTKSDPGKCILQHSSNQYYETLSYEPGGIQALYNEIDCYDPATKKPLPYNRQKAGKKCSFDCGGDCGKPDCACYGHVEILMRSTAGGCSTCKDERGHEMLRCQFKR
jgi:hypothetical protein